MNASRLDGRPDRPQRFARRTDGHDESQKRGMEMSGVALSSSTDDESVDALLREVIDRVEQALPERVRGYYVVGSHADGSALPASDIDLDIVVKAAPADEAALATQAAILDIVNGYAASHAVDLGAFLMDEAHIHGIGNPAFKLASLFLYGQDIRANVPLLPIEEWARQLMHSMYLVTGRERGLSALVYPLEYPDPRSEFYGYDRDAKPRPDRTTACGTRGLVTGAGWYATALTALKARQYVLRKRDAPRLYQQYVGDEWAPFLDTLYARCRSESRYQLPTQAIDREALCELCARYLAFENHFLSTYKDFVLSELQGDDELAARQALRALHRLPYQDEHIAATLKAVDGRGAPESRQAAADALHALGN